MQTSETNQQENQVGKAMQRILPMTNPRRNKLSKENTLSSNHPTSEKKKIKIIHEPEVIPYTPDDQTNMTLISDISDNEGIKDNEETDNKSTDTTETDDESTTCNQHQPPMQLYEMNVKLPISYISTLEQFDTLKV
eukprot:1342290-Ditylum_brightwellii.AAC.1